ncbi:hypothetical protein AAC387_Pa10g1459 [Persea americana]
MAENGSNKKRARVDSAESPESKRIRSDLLDILDDVEFSGGDRDPPVQDLATVMKILEEEIAPASASDSGESQPELGYLLEASDDELGLPPTESSSGGDVEEGFDILLGATEAVGFDEIWRFDDGIPCYDALEIGFPGEEEMEGPVVFEGLFEYPDFVSDFPWRYGSVPAL